MSQLPSSEPAASGLPPAAVVAASMVAEDADYPLGCECADPALQIERWLQECASSERN